MHAVLLETMAQKYVAGSSNDLVDSGKEFLFDVINDIIVEITDEKTVATTYFNTNNTARQSEHDTEKKRAEDELAAMKLKWNTIVNSTFAIKTAAYGEMVREQGENEAATNLRDEKDGLHNA